MPSFCDCGADTYICQRCKTICCSRDAPAEVMPMVGNVCPMCIHTLMVKGFINPKPAPKKCGRLLRPEIFVEVQVTEPFKATLPDKQKSKLTDLLGGTCPICKGPARVRVHPTWVGYYCTKCHRGGSFKKSDSYPISTNKFKADEPKFYGRVDKVLDKILK
jgi:hypothetical protein